MTETLTPHTTAPPSSKAFAIAALLVGILSLVAGLFGWPGIIGGVAAIVLGILAIRRRQSKAMSVTGIVTGSVGIVAGATMLVIAALFIAALNSGVEMLENGNPDDVTVQLEEMGAEVGE